MTAYQVLIVLFLLLAILKIFELTWMLYTNRQFQRTLDQLDRDNQEVMEWFEKLKAERKQ